MSKLIGTNPNQVPSNADLGSAAYMNAKDVLTSRGSGLSTIDNTIPKTAVDVHVYDTAKDSDGGEWRKHSQNTSWYNEELNTATRGSRREFPSVVVIVVEALKVTIYDADDPTLPMWMVFYADLSTLSTSGISDDKILSNTYAMFHTSNLKRADALNGELFVGSSNWHLFRFSFARDDITCHIQYGTFDAGYAKYSKAIIGRNTTGAYNRTKDYGILTSSVNNVKATVLDNAPLDPHTRLPIPTIAVGTGAGLSIIKDDGNVYDVTGSNWGANSPSIGWDKHGILYFAQMGYAVIGCDVKGVHKDYSLNDGRTYYRNGVDDYPFFQAHGYDANGWGHFTDYTVGNSHDFDLAHYSYYEHPYGRVVRHQTNHDLQSKIFRGDHELMNYTSIDHNSGWMMGDIRLATMGDIEEGDVTGSNLVDQTASGWTLPTGFSHDGSGTLTTGSNTGQYSKAVEVIGPLEVGKVYTITFNVTAKSSSHSFWVNDSSSYSNNWTNTNEIAGTGIKSHTFVAEDTNGYVVFQCNALGNTMTVSGISCRIAVEDLTRLNNKAPQVFGTITKRPVAPGAELLGYGGFNSSSVLMLPEISHLPSNSEGCVMFWYNAEGVTLGNVLEVQPRTYRPMFLEFNSGNSIELLSSTNGSSWTTAQRWTVPMTGWNFMCIVGNGTEFHCYVNGEKAVNVYNNGNNGLFGTIVAGDQLRIGSRDNAVNTYTGELSLYRISASVPSMKQIKKIYRDERELFNDNAKCSVYGTADTITALEYDSQKEELHIGNYQGRSVFKGLRRDRYNAEQVSVAISASNGIVIEE